VRRGSIVQLILIGVLAGAIASAVALVPGHLHIPAWLPEPASREAGRIDFVFWFVTGICIFVFSIVAAVSVFAIWKFRAKPDDDSDGPPIHGHTGLEIAWTAVPTVLVTAIAVVSAIVLAKDDAQGSDPLRVEVMAQQFFWSYRYPEFSNKESDILRLPVNRSIVLHMTSKDVIHSFWVPEFRQKSDVVPGIQTTLHITPNKVGTYPVICTELCGLGHALMRSRTIVMTDEAFQKWAAQKGGA
jgi:cytochrome c oxidase subunit II